MKFVICLLVFSGLSFAFSPQQGPPSTAGGGSGGGPACPGGVDGNAVVKSFNTPPAGGGLHWLNAVGTFTAENHEPHPQGEEQPTLYKFQANLTVAGPDAANELKDYLHIDSELTLGPKQSLTWDINGNWLANTAVSGNYVASVSLTAVELPAGQFPAYIYLPNGPNVVRTVP